MALCDVMARRQLSVMRDVNIVNNGIGNLCMDYSVSNFQDPFISTRTMIPLKEDHDISTLISSTLAIIHGTNLMRRTICVRGAVQSSAISLARECMI